MEEINKGMSAIDENIHLDQLEHCSHSYNIFREKLPTTFVSNC